MAAQIADRGAGEDSQQLLIDSLPCIFGPAPHESAAGVVVADLAADLDALLPRAQNESSGPSPKFETWKPRSIAALKSLEPRQSFEVSSLPSW